ncbi:hypothetical protein DND58_05715 [Pseudomonas syringae pv. pisi]|jgi:hypothetical protein|uniref:hypothetical protein n=1 Tax=Pseudomonas viridiflava TaxID=33069 RepID=UPI000D999238|nr:hypothetical protein [Pseudomonas viridiflava]MEE4697085.1 hypothetical protein [Pseudomonas alliivorans]MEE5146550.1 hypothetical protein [Pseudomonas alliivorans]PYD32868.1 hypothetical protein DND58_05715 [Pseudomonas syringae pv. pisi]
MNQSNSEPVTLRPYYEALNRLVAGHSTLVPAGTKITLNAVALEAGKSAGSIKKSRPVYAPLIREIELKAKAQLEKASPGAFKVDQAKRKMSDAKQRADSFEQKYKAALGRELMLLRAWDKMDRRLRQIDNVVSLHPANRPGQ